MLKLDLSQLAGFLPQGYAVSRQTGLKKAADMLAAGNGPGGDFTGWVALPEQYDREEFARIQAAAERIKRQSQVLVVVGIGGSYLGARAVIELLSSPNYNLKVKDTPDIYFAGNGLSTDALLELIALIGDRDFSVNVISKSGHHYRACGGFPDLQGDAGAEVRQGGSQRADLRHHRPGKRGTEGPGGPGGVRDLRGA